MKKIVLRVPGATQTIIKGHLEKEQARKIIADLQAQLDAPEPMEFWEGQLVRRGHTRGIHVYEGRSEFTSDHSKLISSDGKFITVSTASIRPLQDPLIDQYKPLAKGELIPEIHLSWVRIKRSCGAVLSVVPKDFNKFRASHDDVIGWMPADGWGGE